MENAGRAGRCPGMTGMVSGMSDLKGVKTLPFLLCLLAAACAAPAAGHCTDGEQQPEKRPQAAGEECNEEVQDVIWPLLVSQHLPVAMFAEA